MSDSSMAEGRFVGSKERLDASLAQAVAAQDVPGIVACAATRDGSNYRAEFGVSDLVTGTPLHRDALFYIASMTKTVTAVAAMQLVEAGSLELDVPLDSLIPRLRSVQVLEGFDIAGNPRLRAPKTRITLRHLLTHTAGFAYGHWNPLIKQYAEQLLVPDILSMREAALDLPLVNDPGEAWHYGISTDYVGKAVEAASGERLDRYFVKHIFDPLGMKDTYYTVPLSAQCRIAKIHARQADGGLLPLDFASPTDPEFYPGGVGLFTTAEDYLTLTRMLLNGGILDEARLLEPATVDLMAKNHLGSAIVSTMESQIAFWSENVNLYPNQEQHWGLGFLLNTQTSETGVRPGSLKWAGACNSFFWIDRTSGVTGVFMSQVVPFCDERALRAFHNFERVINDAH